MAAAKGTLTRLLEVARKEIGYNEVPRNRNKYGRAYGMDGVAWCMQYVWWVCVQAGVKIIKTAYTPTGAAWFQKNGRWLSQNSKAVKPGMVVFFYWPYMGRIAHVGIVERVLPNGNLVTIEGNSNAGGSRTGGGVVRQIRSRATVGRYGGFGILDFAPDFPPLGKHPHPTPNIRFGDEGPHVKDVQRHINGQLHTYAPASVRPLKKKIAEDGVYGHNTKNRMKELQKLAGVPVTGTVGGTTWKAIHGKKALTALKKQASESKPKEAKKVETGVLALRSNTPIDKVPDLISLEDYVRLLRKEKVPMKPGTEEEVIAVAIAFGESGTTVKGKHYVRPKVVNDNAKTGDYSIGINQINYVKKYRAERIKAYGPMEQQKNPVTNIRTMVKMYLARKSRLGWDKRWTDWGAFNNGSYKRHLAKAKAAIAKVNKGG